MTLRDYPFDADQFLATGSLFSSDLADDPYVFYHGTSGALAPGIEQEGLSWAPRLYQAEDVVAVRSVFESMNWAGLRSGGFGVLASFTDGDFAGSNFKPIYLSSESWQASFFALKEAAGGETARGLRFALEDLRAFLEDPQIARQHLAEQRTNCIRHARTNQPPCRVIDVDVAWLARQLELLAPLEERLQVPLAAHLHGLVYALRIPEQALSSMADCRNSGVECYVPIPREWLLARLPLADDQCHWISRSRGNEDVLGAQMDRRDSREHVFDQMTAPSRRRESRAVVVPRDAAAGRDLALDIVAAYGTDAVKRLMVSRPDFRTD